MAAAAASRAIGSASGALGRVAPTSGQSLKASGGAHSPAGAARPAQVHIAAVGVKARHMPATRTPTRSAPYCIGEGALPPLRPIGRSVARRTNASATGLKRSRSSKPARPSDALSKGACRRSNETEAGRPKPTLIPCKSRYVSRYIQCDLSDRRYLFSFRRPDRNPVPRQPKASLGTAPETSFRVANRRKGLFSRPFPPRHPCRGGELWPSDACLNGQLWIVVGSVALGLAPMTPCPVSIRAPL